jgi:hypothetical protein
VVAGARDLLQGEAALARTELKGAVAHRAVGAAAMAVAAVAGLMMVIFGSLAATAGLAIVLPAWAAALIVAGVWMLVAGLCAQIGRHQMRQKALQETKRTLQEDVRWAKAHVRRSRTRSPKSTGSGDAWTTT